jgi:hypothetical protein
LPGTALYYECVEAGLIEEEVLDFEDFSFGAFDLQLSTVPVEQLKAIRKIEWLKTVMLDQDGRFRSDLPMNSSDAILELENGMRLFPDQPAMRHMYEEARAFYGTERLALV